MTVEIQEPQANTAALPLLTASRMRCFRACPRLHQLRYVEGWRPTVEAEALRFGTLIHTGLEAWLSWHRFAGASEHAEALALDAITAALQAIQGRAFDEFEQARAEELLSGYDAWWGVKMDEYEVLGAELEYRAPLLNPATMRASRTWQLGGKIDGILRRRSDGRVLVMEHKTTSDAIESDADNYWSTLALDGQISGYVIGAEALGYQVDEILYDVIRKVGQRPKRATPEAERKYRQPKGPDEKTWAPNDPRLLYATQRLYDETPDEYRARIREEIQAAPERYFQRRVIARTESQIRDYLQDAWQLGRGMADMAADGYAPRNPDACHRFGACSMWSVCGVGAHPSDFPTEFRQSSDVNPELGTH